MEKTFIEFNECEVQTVTAPVCRNHTQRGSARRFADKLEKHKMAISLKVLLQTVLKYAYKVDILIHQFDHIEFFEGTLPIFQNF